MGWYDRDYGYKKKITILAAKVSGDETDFPVLISVTHADFKTEANGGHVKNANGYDMVFTNSAETGTLKHEIQRYVSATGEIIFWVKVPSLSSSSNTIIYIYYGKEGVSVDPTTTDTWKTAFTMVQHMHGSAANRLDDSTSNGYDINNDIGDPGYNQPGKIGYCVEFSGNDYLDTGSTWNFGTEHSVSFWLRIDTYKQWTQIIGRTGSMYTAELRSSDGTIAYGIAVGGNVDIRSTANDCGDGDWHHCIVTRDDRASEGKWYIDGVDKTGIANLIDPVDLLIEFIGKLAVWTWSLVGALDEIRIYDEAVTPQWALTEFNNQDAPNEFFTLDSEEEQSSYFTKYTSKTSQEEGGYKSKTSEEGGYRSKTSQE